MQVLAAVLGTYGASMTIEDGVVGYLHFVIEIYQLLNVLVFVLHVVTLPYITDYASVEAFNYKFQRPNPKGITWLQNVIL